MTVISRAASIALRTEDTDMGFILGFLFGGTAGFLAACIIAASGGDEDE